MDRLHALIASVVLALLLAFVVACEGAAGEPPPPPPASRTESVVKKAPSVDPLIELCDVRAEPGQGAPLALPPVDHAPSEPLGGAQWLNVWATWCKPCVEEMPMIERFRSRLAREGVTLRVHFVSVDATPELLTAFRNDHPGLPQSMRMTDPTALAPFIQGLGLDAGAGLPIHALTGPDGRVRCVRSGAVLESHFDALTRVFR
jgi:thiol-disulfide isomerase/thioredoxin